VDRLSVVRAAQDFPPYSTVQGYFYRWRDDGTWERVSRVLVAPARRQVRTGRAPRA